MRKAGCSPLYPYMPLRWDASSGAGPDALARQPEEVDDCHICMAQKVDTTLPCTHAFCHDCITQWSARNHGCPMCRQEIGDVADAWVLQDVPTTKEVRRRRRHALGRTMSVRLTRA